MSDLTNEEILAELGLEADDKPQVGRSPVEARLIAGFEDILRFVDQHRRTPRHGEGLDIFERLYAERLDRINANGEYRALVKPFDRHGLISDAAPAVAEDPAAMDDEALLAELQDFTSSDISTLTHVKPRAEMIPADDVANRVPCADFGTFRPLFLKVQQDLDAGLREARRFARDASIAQGEFFILGGQVVYVDTVGEPARRTKDDRPDSRLRVIYDNGTESDILLRSLQRALYKDDAGRRITDPDPGPLFGDSKTENDADSGTIYVLRSKSEHPAIAANRENIHKIGVTRGEAKARISGAETDATYLFASADVVATYKLYNINRSKLENLLHRVFARARLDVEIPDRFGRTVRPKEWFLVPLSAIDEAVERIRDRSITKYVYDPGQAKLVTTTGK